MSEQKINGRERLRRSMHFVPGANEKMLTKSLETEADGLILDLEDAVTPDRKKESRNIIAGWLREIDFGRKERTIRINPLDTPWGYPDLRETMIHPPDAYVIPKPNSLEDVLRIDNELTMLEREYGHAHQGVGLILIATETARGALNIESFGSCPRVVAMSWGAEDLSAATVNCHCVPRRCALGPGADQPARGAPWHERPGDAQDACAHASPRGARGSSGHRAALSQHRRPRQGDC